MKKVFSTFILILLIFSGCDFWVNYTFRVNNSTQETITLKFELYPTENQEEVILLPGEEKVVRVIPGPLNSGVHDCLTEHGIGYFRLLVFDTYVNDEKLEKQLWQSENWTYRRESNYSAEYMMTITDKMIEK